MATPITIEHTITVSYTHLIDSIDKQQAMIRQQQELVQEIKDAINEIVCGVEYDDEFYKHILDKMVVNDKDNIEDVYKRQISGSSRFRRNPQRG